MANPGYVRSTDGNNADNGSTWALANATLAGAMADQAAGDRIWVSDNHAESQATTMTVTVPGTLAAPCQILGGDDAAEPPTALSSAPSITTTGTAPIVFSGCFYAYGLNVNCGNGASSGATLTLCGLDNDHQVWEQCAFAVVNTNLNGRIIIGPAGSGAEGSIVLKNCTYAFAAVGQGFNLRQARIRFEGGSLIGSVFPNNLIATAPLNGMLWEFSGVDLSAAGSTMNMVITGAAGMGRVVFRDCKLPSGWSGNLLGGAPAHLGFRAEMHNCSDGDTNYGMWVEDIAGSIKHETTLVRTGGANDGTTTLAWKMASSATASYPAVGLLTPEIAIWNDAVGSPKTATVEILHDSATPLTDGEVWLEVLYLGTSSFPLGAWVSDAKSSVIASAANQASSSATWTTTGMSNPNKQKLEVTFTPQEKGFLIARVVLAKASYTVYVDPKVTLS